MHLVGHWKHSFLISADSRALVRLVGLVVRRDQLWTRLLDGLWPSLSRLLHVSQCVCPVILCVINASHDKNFFDRFPSQLSKFRDLITTCLKSGICFEASAMILRMNDLVCSAFLGWAFFEIMMTPVSKVFQMPAIEIDLWSTDVLLSILTATLSLAVSFLPGTDNPFSSPVKWESSARKSSVGKFKFFPPPLF